MAVPRGGSIPPPPTPAEPSPTPSGLKLEVNIDPPEQTVMEGEMVEFECTVVALVRLEVNPSCPNLSPGADHTHLGARGRRNSNGSRGR